MENTALERPAPTRIQSVAVDPQTIVKLKKCQRLLGVKHNLNKVSRVDVVRIAIETLLRIEEQNQTT